MKNMRFAVIGAGFWSQFQIAAWKELSGVEPVAIYNRTKARAEAVAKRFGIPAIYDDAEELFATEQLDFVDIITNVETHGEFVRLAAKYKVPAICQKPMATSYAEAKQMVEVCQEAGIPLMIHENWRWQYPLRQLKQALETHDVGRPFRARIQFSNSFPVFDNQPFLKELEQFILTDIGSHILDTARFLFGDANKLYCQTARVNPEIKGEDVATVMMEMGDTTVVCDMSYASRTEYERFPETFVFVECEKGSVELAPDYWVRVTTAEGTFARRCPPPRYQWADPAYDLVHSSILPANADFLQALQSGGVAETSGEDNLRTVELVFAAYESAASGRTIHLK